MRLGTLQLSGDWDESQAQIVALRFRELETTINDLQYPPHAHMYVSQDPGMDRLLSPAGTTCILTGATVDHIEGFDFLSDGSTSRYICRVPAHYFVNYSVSFGVSSVGPHVEIAVVRNGVWQERSASHWDFTILGSGQEVTVFGSVILELQRGDYIEIGARCVGSTTTITYEHFNSAIFRIHY
jgi:hypothetical protein